MIRRKNHGFQAAVQNGPPPRSFAADAHDCIMVQSSRTDRIQGCGAISAPDDELPLVKLLLPRYAPIGIPRR